MKNIGNNNVFNKISQICQSLTHGLSSSHRNFKKILFSILLLQLILFAILWSSNHGRISKKPLTEQQKIDWEQQTQINPHLMDPDYDYFRNSNSNNDLSSTDDYITFLTDYLSSWYQSTDSTNPSTVDLGTLSKLYEKLKYNTKPFWFDDLHWIHWILLLCQEDY